MRIVLLLLVSVSVAIAQTPGRFTLQGTVKDQSTGKVLAAVNVRISGTSSGTITNTDGWYVIHIGPGDYSLIYSLLGYQKDTANIHLAADFRRDVSLVPSPIVLPEIAVSSEDPAIEIIRRAIANRQHWIERLHSYEMHAFTRQTLYRDTAVAAISEAFTEGYWQAGDTLREIVTQKRQTANLPAAENIASVGRIVNFSEDNIRLLGFTFVGPTAVNALEYYDYKLLRTRPRKGQDIYEIRQIPRTQTVPLFRGTIHIASDSYALMGVDVSPNDAFRIPFIRNAQLRYRQEFGLYESTFWLPADIRIEGSFSIFLAGFSFPRVGIHQTSVITDYAINVPIPDSIFAKPRLVQDSSAARVDSTYWSRHVVLPLSIAERKAYSTLDSSQSLDIQFRPGGAAIALGGGSEGLDQILSHSDLWFNRAEGFHLGGKIELQPEKGIVATRVAVGYAFTPRLLMYELEGTLYTSVDRSFGIGGAVYRRADHHPDRAYYGPLFNSLTSLFFRNDYRDYYLAEGVRAYLRSNPSQSLFAQVSYVVERERAFTHTTDYSWFSRSRPYRLNPPPAEGMLRDLRLDARIGPEAIPFDLVMHNTVGFSLEHASPRLTGGDFSFTRYEGILSLSIPTFARRFMLSPGFRVRASAGGTAGTPPPQRWFDLESASSGVSPLGTMHALNVKEYGGTRYVALHVEHNFRSLLFLALGIPFLYENEIELIVHGGAAKTWVRDASAQVKATNGWYSEAGFAVSRILGFIRMDGTWRLSAPRYFRVTAMIAGIL
jgi:hypothetical protein